MLKKLTFAAAVAAAVVLGVPLTTVASPGSTSASAKQQSAGVTKSPNGVYIAIMDLDPVVAYRGEIKGYAATKPGKGRKVDTESASANKYRGLLKQSQEKALARVGVSASRKVHSYTVALNGVAVRLSLEEAQALARVPGEELRQG